MLDYNTYSDSELIDLLKTSDHAAFSEIYRRYYYLIFKEAFKKLGEEDAVRDIVQDLFTNLWVKREQVSKVNNLAGYLINAVKNRVFDYFGHQNVKSRYIDSLKDYMNTGNIAHTDYLVREKEVANYIEKAVQELPKKMKRIFELSRHDNLTHKEIAQTLSLSERTVNAQMSNALYRLKTKLGTFLSLLL